MKKILIVAVMLLAGLGAEGAKKADPFFVPTKNKTVKRMTRQEVKKASLGKTLYVRHGGKIRRR